MEGVPSRAIMREYELTLVFSPDIPDEDIPGEIDKVAQLVIQKGGATTAEADRWGRRKLAYPIKKSVEGNYVVSHFKLPANQTVELERKLESSEGILRHLLISLGD